jgi:hypothetical protein
MPQPLSSYRTAGNYALTADVLTNLPALGGLVARVIAGWAMTEAHLGHVFAELIGAKYPVTMQIYSEFRSFETQRKILETAAREMLPKRYALMLAAALIVLNKVAIERHKFVHWVWGASADVGLAGDSLLLVEPKHSWHLRVKRIRHWKKFDISKEGPAIALVQEPRLSTKDIFVYRLPELKEINARVERAFRIAESLRQLVVSTPARRKLIYKMLDSEPDVHSALRNLKKAQKGPRERPKLIIQRTVKAN